MTRMLLTAIIITLTVSGHMVSGDDCNGVIHTVTFDDLYNGVDTRISGPSAEKSSPRDFLLSSGVKNTIVTSDDVVQIVFNTREPVTVMDVAFKSFLGEKATVTIVGSAEEDITKKVRKSGYSFHASFDSAEAKSVEIQLIPDKGTQADISDLQVDLCVSPCGSSSELTFANYESYLEISSSDIVNAANIMADSGHLVIPIEINSTSESGMFPVANDIVTVDITFNQTQDLINIAMETTHVKSVSVKIYDENNKRLYRDTVVAEDPMLLEALEQQPIMLIVGAKSINLEFRVGDYDAIGIQNLAVGICSD